MKYPKPIIFGYTWVGILNQLLFQWFFIRLQMYVKDGYVLRCSIIGLICPLTGWWNKYWRFFNFEVIIRRNG